MECNKTCRLCTRMGDNFNDILKQTEIIQIVHRFFDIRITEEDQYHFLCIRCDDKLKDLSKFCKEIEEAQKYFEDLTNIVVIQVKPDEFLFDEPSQSESENEEDAEEEENNVQTKPSSSIQSPYDFLAQNSNVQSEFPLLHQIKNEPEDDPPASAPASSIQSDLLSLEGPVQIKTEPMDIADTYIKKEIFEAAGMDGFSDTNPMNDMSHLTTGDMSGDASHLYHLLNQDPETEEEDLKCPQCDRTFKDTYSYDQHQLTHLTGEQTEQYKVQCEYCKKYYMGDDFLATHIREHHTNKDSSVSCGECGQVCKNLDSLHRHHKAKHTAPTMMNCPDCGEEVRVHYYDRHRRAKHVEKPPAICAICSKAFKNRHHLLNHQYRVHTDPKFGCEICGRLFKTKSHLKKHHNSHVYHQNDADIVCQRNMEIKFEDPETIVLDSTSVKIEMDNEQIEQLGSSV